MFSFLWAGFTVAAAAAQTLRNAFQHDLTERLGAANDAFVRFLFGFPFAAAFFAGACLWLGAPPLPGPRALALVCAACIAQVLGTALMLAAMRERSFIVATILTKTEPAMIVLFDILVLAAPPSPAAIGGAALATLGLLAMSPPGAAKLAGSGGSRAIWLGLGSAAAFGVSTLGFRAAVLALETPNFILAGAEIAALALAVQTTAILLWLGAFDRPALRAIAAAWRGSLTAGAAGASSTILWFFALALESAARVRTLGLVEVVFAGLVSRRLFAKGATPREWLGALLVCAGAALALNG